MHAVKPLPFAASKLRGLSENIIVSHHENNYGAFARWEELFRLNRRRSTSTPSRTSSGTK
jgi:hypothetical protein